MKKLIVIIALFSLCISNIYAQEKSKKNKNVEFAVSGNCDMCKKRIEKATYSVKGVKFAEWHIDHKDIHLIFDENKCSLDDVKKAIAKVGHDTDTILATDEDYNTLHHCCLYRSEE